MGFRIPAPDGKKGRDGHPVLVLPYNTEINGSYTVSYFTVGGMSVAYKGIKDGLTYFIKEVESTDSKKVTSLMQEREILERLNHPGIVKVYDFFEYDGFHYLVQEYIDGQTLERLISPIQNVFLQERVILEWASQILDIIEYLHRQSPRIIYRDLKPSNIIRDKNGRIHLVDFGIARLYREGKSKDTESMGSALTASPEHYGRGQTDVRSDIFTIGATLHYLATNGRERSEIPFEYEAVRSINPKISPDLEYVIHKALDLNPEKRFQSIAELRSAMSGRSENSELPPLREDRAAMASSRLSSDRVSSPEKKREQPLHETLVSETIPPSTRDESAAYQNHENNIIDNEKYNEFKKKYADTGRRLSQFSPILATVAFILAVMSIGALVVRYIVYTGSDRKKSPIAQASPIVVSSYVVLNDSWPHTQTKPPKSSRNNGASTNDPGSMESLLSPAKAPDKNAGSSAPRATKPSKDPSAEKGSSSGRHGDNTLSDPPSGTSNHSTQEGGDSSTDTLPPPAGRNSQYPGGASPKQNASPDYSSSAASAASHPARTTAPAGESPVAIVTPVATPAKASGPVYMCPVGAVLDGDVVVPEYRFRIRIPQYKRVPPSPGEVPDRETTVYSFIKKSSGDNQERFLKVVICSAPKTLEDQNVYNLYYNKLHKDGATEIEKLSKNGNEFRGVFSVVDLIDNSETELVIEQRLILSNDRKAVYILVAGGSSQFFRTYQTEEFNLFFTSFSFL
ncbi:MAG: protein kinase [Candidatus Xenobiia bacterium LiM19]